MKKINRRLILISVFLAGAVLIAWQFFRPRTAPDQMTVGQVAARLEKIDGQKISMVIANQKLDLEVAASSATRSKGLSNRDEIGSDGMLFAFDQLGYPIFWMYQTRIPLDFVWLANGQVVDITPDVPVPAPGVTTQNLPTYKPKHPAHLMIELPAGDAAKRGIKPGDQYHFQWYD